jgi:hypothetical protein
MHLSILKQMSPDRKSFAFPEFYPNPSAPPKDTLHHQTRSLICGGLGLELLDLLDRQPRDFRDRL